MLKHPFAIMAEAMHGAKDEDDLANRAAALGPPPPVDFAPQMHQPMMGGPAAEMKMPKAGPMGAMMPQQGKAMVPPMSQGEARTKPRMGDYLVGGN